MILSCSLIKKKEIEKMVTFKDVKNNQAISEYIRQADRSLLALGYTEHSFAHVGNVQNRVKYIG